MRHFSLTLPSSVCLLLLALAPASGAGEVSTAPSTLPEIARSAVASHESVARADSLLRRAEADMRLTSSALLPRLELNGMYTRFGDEQAIELAPGESFVIRPLSDWSWSADLTQTLFYGLRDWRARSVARLYRETADLNRQTATADLVLTVAHAFYDTVAAEQRLEVRRTALEQIRAQLKVAERRFDVGEVAQADVARWRAQAAAERQAVVEAEGVAELARRRLARLAGVPALGTLRSPGPIPPPEGASLELVERALGKRVEMQALERQLQAAGLMIRVEKGARLPELEAHAQYYQQKSVFPSQDWVSLALSLRVPVYDGGLAAARVAKAREDLLEVEILQREVQKTIADQVEASAIRHTSAEAALTAARERQIAAREAHRQVERAYRVGEASATDLLATTTELTDAETAAIIARWQREFEAIALRHAVGEPPLPDLDLVPVGEED
jgi:outer membrane protein TolC